MKNFLENNLSKVVLIALVILGGYFLLNKNSDTKEPEVANVATEESSAPINSLSEDEIKTQLDSTLDVLMRLHYVSVVDKTSTNPESVIVDELTESMNDLNKLNGLVYKTETLSKSGNEIIATTGLVLNLSTIALIKSYDSWIQYLRGIDVNDGIDLAEFQYQLATFGTSTHDVYLTLIEGASLLPMITVEFATEEGGENLVNENLKNHFLAKIDQLFGDIFIDNDAFYKETGNRYAVAVLVKGYKDFFQSE
ncbi:MAG: hypothetical protein WD963_02340 [Candidatus Paceibacterota bacterium]